MTQPPTPLQSCLPGSHDIMYLLTCELAVSRFATRGSVPQIGQTLPDIRTAVPHAGVTPAVLLGHFGPTPNAFRTARNLHQVPTPLAVNLIHEVGRN